ncbi:MAG: AmmeMemoRadiSam system protein B [Rhodospirillales bacterium]
MTKVRPPAVAGLFYPEDAAALARSVDDFIAAASKPPADTPKAIIVPHAGHIYSGPVAARAYAALAPLRGRIARVVLIGPSHRLPFKGLALPSDEAFQTPLGAVPVDTAAVATLLELPQVMVLDAAHDREHSLEVHLPFLQRVLGSFALVPLVAGDASAEDVAEVIEAVWHDDRTLPVISTDLSHYNDYATAREMDAATAAAIERLDGAAIGRAGACGRVPVRGLLAVAKRRGLHVATLDLRNSGDTAGTRDRVVGYGSWLVA